MFPPLFLTIDPVLYAETLHLSEEEAQSYLETIAIEWSTADLPITTAVTAGSVAESIIGYTQQTNINLIVMSSHGQIPGWAGGCTAASPKKCCARAAAPRSSFAKRFSHRQKYSTKFPSAWMDRCWRAGIRPHFHHCPRNPGRKLPCCAC
ncbi:MAG: universal stress protein [Chloroflexi bacterium]|nr:universal stress protein [Chloroflexota bacterium]